MFLTGFAVVVSESSARRYALDPDVRLMLEVRDDSAAAFEELVARYQGRLVTVLKHQVGSRELAEDLAQDVFLRMYRARKSYEPGAKFAAWLFTIANHVAANALRTQSRRRLTSAAIGSGRFERSFRREQGRGLPSRYSRQCSRAKSTARNRLGARFRGQHIRDVTTSDHHRRRHTTIEPL